MSSRSILKPMSVEAAKMLSQMQTSDYAVYLQATGGNKPILYREQGMGLSIPDFERLSEAGVTHILVRGDELNLCEKALEDNLSRLMHNAQIAPDQKAACVQQVGTALVRDLTKTADPSETLQRAASFLDLVIDGVLSDPMVTASLLQMSSHHETTASHMFAVSTLAVLLGTEIIGSHQESLREIGLAGMLHDLGKLKVNPNILNKTQPLTPDELRILQHHPIESVRLVGDDPIVTSNVRQMILQHHERYDGRGYPLGLRASDQLVGSQVLCLVDSFHALVGRRRYRQSVSAPEAIRILGFQNGKQFDPALFKAWKELFERCWDAKTGEIILQAEKFDAGGSFHSDDRPHQASSTMERKTPRLLCNDRTSVRCLYVGKLRKVQSVPDELTLSVKDLSRAGICVATEHPMYAGEIVHVMLLANSEKIWVQGIVRWCRQQKDSKAFNVGVQFASRICAKDVGRRVEALALEDPEMFPQKAPTLPST